MKMRTYITGGSSANSTINDASGENDGPSIPVIGAVVVAAYIGYKTLFDGGM